MSRASPEMSQLVQNQPQALTNSEFRTVKGTECDLYRMGHIFSNDIVFYKCSCNEFRRLTNSYFCRHCMILRCMGCVAYEVDSQYCQHCLEYIPTIDPKFQMNKCASCYQCPSCRNLLSTSVRSISPSTSDQVQQQTDEVTRRTCQLICEFCRWSSATFVVESSRMNNNLADVEVENASKISDVMAFYKAVSMKEKTDKKKRRFHSRTGNTMDLLKKYGIDNTLSPKLFESLRARSTLHDKSSAGAKLNLEPKTNEEITIEEFRPAEAVELDDLEPLNTDFYYDNNYNFDKISGIEQRLAQIELQPELAFNYRPVSKSLSVKRSLRCRECERNLCRSEYSPISIRFKIQSAAYYHVPELKLRSDIYPLELKLNEFNVIEFSLQNQTLSKVRVKLDKLSEEDDELYEIMLPQSELNLGPKDDTLDHEHVPLNIRPLNEETQIIFQSPFIVGFFIKIFPKRVVDCLEIKFKLTHDVILLQNQRENDKIDRITHTMKVRLGKVE